MRIVEFVDGNTKNVRLLRDIVQASDSSSCEGSLLLGNGGSIQVSAPLKRSPRECRVSSMAADRILDESLAY